MVVGYCVWVIDSGLLFLVCWLLVRSWFAVASWSVRFGLVCRFRVHSWRRKYVGPCRIDQCAMTCPLLSYTILPYYGIEAPFPQREGSWPPLALRARRESHHPSPFPFKRAIIPSLKERERERGPTTSSLRKRMWRRVCTQFYTRWLCQGHGFCKFTFWVLRSWILHVVS